MTRAGKEQRRYALAISGGVCEVCGRPYFKELEKMKILSLLEEKMEINQWFSENFKEPESMMEEKCFTFIITGKEVEIECSWDYDWGGCGTERIFIPLETLEKFIADHRKELVRRSNGRPTK